MANVRSLLDNLELHKIRDYAKNNFSIDNLPDEVINKAIEATFRAIGRFFRASYDYKTSIELIEKLASVVEPYRDVPGSKYSVYEIMHDTIKCQIAVFENDYYSIEMVVGGRNMDDVRYYDDVLDMLHQLKGTADVKWIGSVREFKDAIELLNLAAKSNEKA